MIEAAKALLLLGAAALWLSVVLFGRRRISENAAAVLSSGWLFTSFAGLGATGVLPGTVSDAATPSLGGVPVTLLLTVAAAAGPLVVYAGQRLHWAARSLIAWVVSFGLAALYLESASDMDAKLGLLLLLVVTAPAHALAAWTAEDSHVGARSVLQGLMWTGLLLWVFPSIALVAEDRDWSFFLARTPREHLLWLAPLAAPAALIIAALWQFAREGGGTGFPYDPPKRLVCQGIYAHLSNPMQLGIVLLLGWWGVVLQSPVVTVSAPVAILLFIAFSDVCSGVSNVAISDPRWQAYKRNVPAWWPRTSPWRAPQAETPTGPA